MSEKFSIGDEVLATEQNQIWRGGSSVDGLLAGETINGATLPVAVYQNTTDNEFYACDADDTDKLNFIGFAISNSTDGNSIDIQFEGIMKGFTGLSEGVKYYVQNDKTIGTTPGTYKILVGMAISTTEILIIKELPTRTIVSNNLRHSNDDAKGNTGQVYTKVKEILINVSKLETIRVKFGLANPSTINNAYGKIYKNGSAIGTEQNNDTANYVEKTQDFSNTFIRGDLIQIYVKHDSVDRESSVNNFRIYYDREVVPNELFYTNQDPV